MYYTRTFLCILILYMSFLYSYNLCLTYYTFLCILILYMSFLHSYNLCLTYYTFLCILIPYMSFLLSYYLCLTYYSFFYPIVAFMSSFFLSYVQALSYLLAIPLSPYPFHGLPSPFFFLTIYVILTSLFHCPFIPFMPFSLLSYRLLYLFIVGRWKDAILPCYSYIYLFFPALDDSTLIFFSMHLLNLSFLPHL